MRYYQAIVLLLAIFAVLTGIQAAVTAVDPATVPEEWRTIWYGIVYIFTTSAATPLFTFFRNIYGYAENYYDLRPEERGKLEFEAHLMAATYAKYEGYIKAITIFVIAFFAGTPWEPYAALIAGTCAFILDMVRKSLKDLQYRNEEKKK